MALPLPTSYTSDPKAGRRFIVGMQGAQPEGVLGFGMTKAEADALRGQRIAEEMGLPQELANAAPYIGSDNMAKMGVRSILEGQEEAQRTRYAEQQFQRQMEARRQQQAEERAERQAKI